MDIRTKSQGGEPTYNVSLGKATKGKISCHVVKFEWVACFICDVCGKYAEAYYIFVVVVQIDDGCACTHIAIHLSSIYSIKASWM